MTSGSLPSSLRLTVRDHNFDLAASCDAEKELWAAELQSARDESTVPPFELPSSVPLFAARSRHSSTTSRDTTVRLPGKRHTSSTFTESPTLNSKRHTFVGAADFQVPVMEPLKPEDSAELSHTPEYRQSQPSTVLIRRPSLTTRLMVDRALSDVVSEGLATARSKSQLQYPSGPDPRRTSRFDTPMLRRRRSLAGLSEMRPVDVVSKSEVRGAVIPGTRPRSLMRTRSFVLTPTTTAEKENSDISRNTSFSSLADAHKRRSPMTTLRGLEMTMGPTPIQTSATMGHKRAQSASTLSQPLVQSPIEMMEDEIEEDRIPKTLNRARSMPSSPVTPTVAAFPSSRNRGANHRREDSYVLVGSNLPAPPARSTTSPQTSAGSMSPAKAVKRSLSFFGRKGLSALQTDSSDDFGTMSTSTAGSGAPSRSTTPPTPEVAPTNTPNTPKRRRSLRLLDQFRGFTPI